MKTTNSTPLSREPAPNLMDYANSRGWKQDQKKALVDLLIVTVVANESEVGPITWPPDMGINARFHPARERGGVASVEIWAEEKRGTE